MPVQPPRKEGDRNPQTADEAKALVKHVESLFMPWNIDALVAGFADDCVVRFGTLREFRGREALRFLCRAQQQAEGLSAQEELPHADKRHHHQHLGRRMAGRRKRHCHARLRRRAMGYARRQDRRLGSGVQYRARRPDKQCC
jgi:hypothetical protein